MLLRQGVDQSLEVRSEDITVIGLDEAHAIPMEKSRYNGRLEQTAAGLLARHGFSYCGIIYLKNGSPRLAYQRVR